MSIDKKIGYPFLVDAQKVDSLSSIGSKLLLRDITHYYMSKKETHYNMKERWEAFFQFELIEA